jgi:ADP-ribose pyrophosphatase
MEVFRSRRLSVEEKQVSLPDGRVRDYVVVHPGPAVAMLPVIGEDCLLIRQYRYAIDQYLYEVPAGTMEPGETPVETAHREMIEETGFAAGRLAAMGTILTTPGFSDEQIHLFLATDLVPSSLYQQDEDEVIEVERLSLIRAWAMVMDGTITDAKTICLLAQCRG